jgi:hypothetical protein
MKTCLFCSLASAFHHLGRKHTGSVLASMAKQLCNLPAQVLLDEAIKIVKNHDRLYKKVDYWKKEAVIAKHDLLGQLNDNQNCLYFVELTEASIMQSRLSVVSFLTVTLDSA